MSSRKKPQRKLTKKQALERIARYLNVWAPFLGLDAEWDIKIALVDKLPGEGKSDEDSAAEAVWTTGYRSARLYFLEKELCSCSDADAESYVLHELGHLWYAPVSELIEAMTGTRSTVTDALGVAEETLIDRWTRNLLRLAA